LKVLVTGGAWFIGSHARSVIHPDMLAIKAFESFEDQHRRDLSMIEAGNKPVGWYLATPVKACAAKLRRNLNRAFRR
jgi:UDP-glucose 4-epimerase